MSQRLRELATGVASCALLASAGCRRPPAEVSVDPGDGTQPEAEPAACDPSPTAATPQARPGSSGDREAPRVLDARFVARDRIQLTFTEALAPVEQVNPRQFRLSMGYSMIDYGGGYAHAYYYDLGGSDPLEAPIVFTSLALDAERPEILGLTLNRPVPEELCVDLRDMRADFDDMAAGAAEGPVEQGRVGLFLHYTQRGSVGIRDRADNPLDDMGGEWALHFGVRHKQVYGGEPVVRFDLLVELNCPDESMPLSAPPGPN